MKKLILSSFIAVAVALGSSQSFAQKAYETKVSYMKKDVEAFAADFNVSKDVLNKVAEQYFNDNIKGKRKKNKDFYMYQGINATDIFGTEKGDLYYKVTGNKKNAKLILLVSKGYDNFVSGGSDAQVAANAKNLLNNFEQQIEKYNKAQLIEEQKKLIAKTEKEHKSLISDQKRAEKKLEDQQKEIENLKKKVSNKADEIEDQKKKLDELSKL